MHRTEARLRMGLLNEEAKNIKPLHDTRYASFWAPFSSPDLITRAVQNGATTLAETFLFVVGAGLVLGESYRSSRKEGKRRDEVQDRLEGLEGEMKGIRGLLEGGGTWESGLRDIREQWVYAAKARERPEQLMHASIGMRISRGC
jgi:hypothetical protein